MRQELWQNDFWNAIEEARTKPFEWGTHDCVMFAVNVLNAIRTDDISGRVVELFGTWDSAESALRAMSEGLDACVRQVLGEPVRWPMLSQGDVALGVDSLGREFLCVHDGVQFIGPDDVGLKCIAFAMIRHGWKT